MKITSHLLFAAATLVAASSAQAATQAWNTGGPTDNWNTTDANWTGASTTWTNGNDAIFGGTGEAISIGAGISAHNLTFGVSGYSIATNTLTLTGTTPTIEVTNLADSATISSIIAGTAGLTKTGAGTLTLTGANSYSGATTISAGVLKVSGSTMTGALLGSGTYLNDSSVSFSTQINGDISGFTGTISYNGNSSGNNLRFNGTGSALDGSQAKFFLSGISAGANRGLGIGTAGTFKMGELSGTGGYISTSVNGNNVTLEVGALGTSTAFAGVIGDKIGVTPTGGIMSLTKVGIGSLTLTGTNTYSGGTTISGGTLLANNTTGSATGTGAVSVASGARLGGTGKVTGAVTVNGTLRGGDGSTASGALTLGNVTLASGSIIELALGSGGTHSSLIFNGTESFQSNQTFSFLDLGAGAGNYASIITGVSSVNTSGWSIANDGWLGTFSWNAGTGAIDLNITAVPEPSTYGLIGAGALAAVAMVRRRRKHAGKVA